MDSGKIKKIAILAVMAVLIGLFFYFDVAQYLNLEYLKESQERFQQLYQQNRVTVISLYMLMYIVVTALSLPGAAIMTLAGGGLFGLITGTIAVSFASISK